VAKVMTAYVILLADPLGPGQEGFTLRLTDLDVADTERRAARSESLVPVQAGEELTEREALTALLLPSANNIAASLARRQSGSEEAFVAQMNDQAHALGMRHTRYTDPSGYAADTVSTASDQLILAQRAMQLAAFAEIVGQPRATIPVAGIITNTDTLLGRDGFVGIKTGSHDAAGGCFMFESHRKTRSGRHLTIVGVVLGQPGRSLIEAALSAAEQLVTRVVAAAP
jgi:D-alanyl-D-alanine carboxypeptidase (penicillin-binding protein 5/6)